MGNTGKGGALRLKNQPRKLQLSTGMSGHSGSNATNQEKETVTIKLENLDIIIVREAKKNAAIRLLFHNGIFEAHFQNQRIGDVPTKHNSRLLPQQEYLGRIFQVQLEPEPAVDIKISLKSAE